MEWQTTTALLEQLADGDDAAWSRFADRYRPPLLAFARRLGVPEAEAEDVAQDSLVAFLDAWRRGRYERARGRLGSFLFGLAQFQVRNHHRRAARGGRQGAADTAFWRDLPDEASLRSTWDLSWKRALFQRCLERVRRELQPNTVRAFELCVLERRTPAQAAEQLGLSVNAVYVAKHRVLTRIQALREEFEDAV